jgi:hypothetical protein
MNFFYLNFHTNFIPDCLSSRFDPEGVSIRIFRTSKFRSFQGLITN